MRKRKRATQQTHGRTDGRTSIVYCQGSRVLKIYIPEKHVSFQSYRRFKMSLRFNANNNKNKNKSSSATKKQETNKWLWRILCTFPLCIQTKATLGPQNYCVSEIVTEGGQNGAIDRVSLCRELFCCCKGACCYVCLRLGGRSEDKQQPQRTGHDRKVLPTLNEQFLRIDFCTQTITNGPTIQPVITRYHQCPEAPRGVASQ